MKQYIIYALGGLVGLLMFSLWWQGRALDKCEQRLEAERETVVRLEQNIRIVRASADSMAASVRRQNAALRALRDSTHVDAGRLQAALARARRGNAMRDDELDRLRQRLATEPQSCETLFLFSQ